MTGDLRGNALINDALGSALRSGDHALGTVPALLKRVLSEESWRHFVTKRGEEVSYQRFERFVDTPPLKGLGATLDLVRRVIADDPVALDMLDQALQNPAHVHPDVHNINVRPHGTSKAQALRRLRTEAERGNEQAARLHADVLAGQTSANAAMIQAGFRPKTVTVPIGRPERVAAYLRRHMPREALARLVSLLSEDQEDG